MFVSIFCFSYVFVRPIYYPRTTLALPPSSKSDPGSHSGPSSPLLRHMPSFLSREELNIFFPPRLASNVSWASLLALTVKYVCVCTWAGLLHPPRPTPPHPTPLPRNEVFRVRLTLLPPSYQPHPAGKNPLQGEVSNPVLALRC